jgi:multiple sugar transport system ATP-binding protein
MKQIEIKNIKKDFYTLRRGRIRALKNINLEIEGGSFFVILGPSGCGKSTLLNIIAGIEKPTEGEITIGGKTVVSTRQKIFLSPRERDVAMVFQSYALYPHMTVFENIAFPLKIAKMKTDEIRKEVEQVSRMLEIHHLIDAKPAELSGGQRQRVALGRAIVRKPNVLLLDEPLSNLDALLRSSMRGQLKLLQRQIGVTTIYVTHDQTEAMSLGDRIAIVNEGEVIQSGTPDEIYNDPYNLFAAKFVGSPPMNILDDEITAQLKNRLQFLNRYDCSNVIAALRPEDIQLTGESEGILTGKLNVIGNLGSEIIAYINSGNSEIIVKANKGFKYKEGQMIGISFQPGNLYLFSKTDGNRIKSEYNESNS